MGDKVKVEPDDVRAIAKKHIATAQDKVKAALAEFEDTADGEHGFGKFEAGSELASLHASVKTVFTSTVDGVTSDLSKYHHNLIAGANAWENSDKRSADRSRALTDRLSAVGQEPLATKHNYNQSRHEQGDKLAPGQTLSDHAHDRQPGSHGEGGPRGAAPQGSHHADDFDRP